MYLKKKILKNVFFCGLAAKRGGEGVRAGGSIRDPSAIFFGFSRKEEDTQK